MIGTRFGKWKVIKKYDAKLAIKQRKFVCRCDCGVTRPVSVYNLKSGASKCCGSVSCRGPSKLIKHGMASSSEYAIWHKMLYRCQNPKATGYENYGGRGITVCKRWKKFEIFIADMGMKPTPKHSVDRIDNNKGYSPKNCRWATPAEQSSNKRTNITYNYNGLRQILARWSDSSGISREALRRRWHKGLRGDALFTTERKFNNKVLIKHLGKIQTLKGWADTTQLPPRVLYERYRKGVRGALLFMPLWTTGRRAVIVRYRGDERSLKELAEIKGINYKTLAKRYRKGLRGNTLFMPLQPGKKLKS